MADKVLTDSYQAGFNVVTYHDVSESNKSYHCMPKANKGEAVQVGADMLAKERTGQDGGTDITWDFNTQRTK